MISIEPAVLTDKAALLELVRKFATSFEVDASSFELSFNDVLQAENTWLLVARADETLIGYILGHRHKAFYANGNVSWVEEIFVLDEYRRQGVGKQLMSSFEAIQRDYGTVLVALATRRADHFYRSLGYEESATYFRKVF